MLLCCSVAFAQSTPKPTDSKKAPPGAGRRQRGRPRLLRALQKSPVGRSPIRCSRVAAGLNEVLIGGQIYYVDSDVSFVLAGRMFDPATREDLTQKRLDVALKVDFKSLPLANAVKTVRGDGSRVLVTFEDPNCGYCKRLWQNMAELKNVTIYTFLYPILSPDSMDKSKAHLVFERSRRKLGRIHGTEQVASERGARIARTRSNRTLRSAATSESTARQPSCL